MTVLFFLSLVVYCLYSQQKFLSLETEIVGTTANGGIVSVSSFQYDWVSGKISWTEDRTTVDNLNIFSTSGTHPSLSAYHIPTSNTQYQSSEGSQQCWQNPKSAIQTWGSCQTIPIQFNPNQPIFFLDPTAYPSSSGTKVLPADSYNSSSRTCTVYNNVLATNPVKTLYWNAATNSICRADFKNGEKYFFYSVQTNGVFIRSEPTDCGCANPVDISVAALNSNTIGGPQLQQQFYFLGNITSHFIFPQANMAVFYYGATPSLKGGIATGNLESNAYSQIYSIPCPGGTPCYGTAANTADVAATITAQANDLATSPRSFAGKVILIVTDGSTGPGNVASAISSARTKVPGVFIVAVQVGGNSATLASSVDLNIQLSSFSSDQFAYSISNRVIPDLYTKMCAPPKGPNPCGANCCGFCQCGNCVHPAYCYDDIFANCTIPSENRIADYFCCKLDTSSQNNICNTLNNCQNNVCNPDGVTCSGTSFCPVNDTCYDQTCVNNKCTPVSKIPANTPCTIYSCSAQKNYCDYSCLCKTS